MKVLVVSYVDYITEGFVEVIKKVNSDAVIDVVKDTWSAERKLFRPGDYDIIVIDMMVQQYDGRITAHVLESALGFLELIKSSSRIKAPEKVFALFDPDETEDRGKDEVTKMGFAVADYNFCSIDWRTKLFEYLSK